MRPEEKDWWQENKEVVHNLKPYDYLKLLLEGEKRFNWSVARVSFLRTWWWSKFGNEWKEKMKSPIQTNLFN